MDTKASLEIITSNQNNQLFLEIENAVQTKRLRYSLLSTEMACFSGNPPDDSSETIITKFRIVPASITLILAFLVEMQPTLQKLIENDSLQQVSISCGDNNIVIKGENKIEDAIVLLRELKCSPNDKSDSKHEK